MITSQQSHAYAYLKTSLAELLEKPSITEELTEHTDLFSVGMDSVTLVNLVVLVEEEFDIFFEDDELLAEHFQTIESVWKRIESKL
jgi:acyl carrier protein